MGEQTTGEAAGHPPYLYPDYKSTRLRAPKAPPVILPKALADARGPVYGHGPYTHLARRDAGGRDAPHRRERCQAVCLGVGLRDDQHRRSPVVE